MNKIIFFIQLLFIYGIQGFNTPEECLVELVCNNDVSCVAYCYSVPAPDNSSVTKTAECQNECLAKYNSPTDNSSLNQCYTDCVNNNYFSNPASAPAPVTNPTSDSNENTSTTSTDTSNNTDADNTSNTANTSSAPSTPSAPTSVPTISTTPSVPNASNTTTNPSATTEVKPLSEETMLNNNSTLNANNTLTNVNKNNTLSNKPINATDHIIIDDESSFIPGFTMTQTFINIALMFLIFIAFN